MRCSKNDIIVVDDNPIRLRVIAEILKERGWQVRSALDGFAALEQIRAQVPDVLLSDLNMTGMSGFELLSVVRRRFPPIAVIATSGAYSDDNVPPGVSADAFYPKGAAAWSICLSCSAISRLGLEDVSHLYGFRPSPELRRHGSIACLMPGMPETVLVLPSATK